MAKKKYKRSQYIVDPEFQYSLIRKIAILAILMIVMSLSVLVIFYYMYGDVQLELIQPSPFDIAEDVNIVPEERTLLDLLWPVMAACLVVTLGITFFFGMFISHRMAGPVFRMQRTLKEMSEGNLRGYIQLRDKDDFKGLAEQINNVTTSYKDRFRELKDLSKALESGDIEMHKEQVSKLNKVLSSVKIDLKSQKDREKVNV